MFLSALGLSKTDDPDPAIHRGEAQDMQPGVKKTKCDKPMFRIRFADIFVRPSDGEIEITSAVERESAFADISLAFGAVEIDVHIFIVLTIK